MDPKLIAAAPPRPSSPPPCIKTGSNLFSDEYFASIRTRFDEFKARSSTRRWTREIAAP